MLKTNRKEIYYEFSVWNKSSSSDLEHISHNSYLFEYGNIFKGKVLWNGTSFPRKLILNYTYK